MRESKNAYDLIKKFEGIRLEAYRDPVGIPTIGYGTIRYADGRRVNIGDRITIYDAEYEMGEECFEICRNISPALSELDVTQNRIDAVISFCYNLGSAAFLGSTLLRKWRDGDILSAADEFLRWNKATIDGRKVELEGLTKRRRAERELFLREDQEETPIDRLAHKRDTVTFAKAYNHDNINYIIAYNNNSDIIEILELEDTSPSTISAAMKCYPKLERFTFAQSVDPTPIGDHLLFSALEPPSPNTGSAPRLDRELLMRGAEDDEAHPGNDVRELQRRLRELGYLEGEVDGVFGKQTDAAVREFQAHCFGLSEADGKVGPKTWEKLWGKYIPAVSSDNKTPKYSYLKLTKTNRLDKYGCYMLNLEYYKDEKVCGCISVCSGRSNRQEFRKGRESRSRSNEPLPEGLWRIGDIKWAGGKDNYYGDVWNNGLGPAKIRLQYQGPDRTERSAIEIHIDWNRGRAPGTAGCVGVRNIADFKRLVAWLRDTDPRDLYVDWNLGTCPGMSAAHPS
jgi:lysozyme